MASFQGNSFYFFFNFTAYISPIWITPTLWSIFQVWPQVNQLVFPKKDTSLVLLVPSFSFSFDRMCVYVCMCAWMHVCNNVSLMIHSFVLIFPLLEIWYPLFQFFLVTLSKKTKMYLFIIIIFLIFSRGEKVNQKKAL